MPTSTLALPSSRLTLLALGLLATGAAAEPSLSLQPPRAKPGDPVLVTVRGVSAEPSGTLDGRPLRFFEANGGFQAITGLPVEQSPGMVEVKVQVPASEEAPAAALVKTLEVAPPTWRVRELKVARKFTEPPPEVKARQKEDRAAFAAAFAQPFSAPLFTGNFKWPREARVTAPYGDQRTFNGKVASQHYGTDLDGATGAPIFAANDGTVVMVRDNYSAGNTVLVYHGADLYTSYFHMSGFEVKPGDRVKRGQLLGRVGRTGRVTGPHLHWGAKVEGRWVDPETLLALDFLDGLIAEGAASASP